MSIFKRIRQYFCKHKFKKHYNAILGCYELRCVKCDKTASKGGGEYDGKGKSNQKLLR